MNAQLIMEAVSKHAVTQLGAIIVPVTERLVINCLVMASVVKV